MAGLRERVLEDLRRDYLLDPEGSVLFRYLLQEHLSGFRIVTKSLLAECREAGKRESGGRPASDRAAFAALQEHLLQSLLTEPKFRNPSGFQALAPLRGDGASAGPKKTNMVIRRAVTSLLDDGRALPEQTLTALAEEMLAAYPDENPAVCFMELWLDLQTRRMQEIPGAGAGPAGGTDSEAVADLEARTARSMQEICRRQKLRVEVTTPVSAETYLRLRDQLIRAEAEAWLLDTGYSVKKETRTAAPARRKNIPIELLEQYLGGKGSGPASLPEDNAGAARDAADLYHVMNAEAYREAVVPLKIDRATGSGVYLLGCGWFEELAGRLGRGEERLKRLLAGRHCVIAEVTHAQAVLDILYAMPGFAGNVTARSWFWENVRVFEQPVTARTVQALFDDFDTAIRYAAEDGTGSGSFTAFAEVNEEAPEHCPERYLVYFGTAD